MPTKQPILDYTQIRNYAERWQWIDPHSGQTVTGFNPPSNAVDKRHVPFTVTFLTLEGMPYKGRAVCESVNINARTRLLRFIEEAYLQMPGYTDAQRRAQFKYIPKGEKRQVSDILIVEIDGVRFSAH